MKIPLTALLLATAALHAQEIVPPEKAREAARQLGRLYGELGRSAFVSKPDLNKPHAVSGGEMGMIFIPETGLSAARLEKVGDELIPLGVLWLRGLIPTPGRFGGLDEASLQSLTVSEGSKRAIVCAFHVGVRKGERGGAELQLFGKGSEALVKTRLLPLPSKHLMPVELAAYGGDGEGAILVVSVTGEFQGEVRIVQYTAEPSGKAIEINSKDDEKAVKAARLLSAHLNEFPGERVKVKGVPEDAVLFEISKSAALLVPHSEIDAARIGQGGEEAIGQLWLKGILPEVDGRPPSERDLKMVTVNADGKEFTLPQFLLTARKSNRGGNELVIYSGKKTELLTLPLLATEGKQSIPVELSGESRGQNRGVLSIAILGRYVSELPVLPVR